MDRGVDFGLSMEELSIENLDFDTINSSVTQMILKSNLEKDIVEIVSEISCLYKESSKVTCGATNSFVICNFVRYRRASWIFLFSDLWNLVCFELTELIDT